MENSTIIILFIFICGVSILLVPIIIEYFKDYFDEIEYIKMELGRAEKWKEVSYWKRQLSATRWTIIPGLSVCRVKAIRKFLGMDKRKKKGDSTYLMLMPSFISIFVSIVCLAGSTFAWFTAESPSNIVTVNAANFTVDTVLKKGEEIITESDGCYILTGGIYSLDITANGTADKGYTVLKFVDGSYYKEIATKTMIKGATVTIEINIVADNSVKLQVLPRWGDGSRETTPPNSENPQSITYPENSAEDSVVGSNPATSTVMAS